MVATMTQKQFVSWIKSSIGKKYDFDGWYGFQCFDYANAGWSKLYPGSRLAGYSAKNIPDANNFSGRAKVYRNTPSFLALPGDMVIFPGTYGGGHGHVAWVLSATLNSITVVEQNWLGGGWTYGNAQGGGGWEAATKRTHSYDANMKFVRPIFKGETAKKTTTKKTTKKKPQTTWMWKGRFTANTTIRVRRSPSINGAIVNSGSWIYKNQWVDFVSVTKKNGYWWIKFKYPTNPSAGYFYLAVCKITDKKERIKKEKYWGKIRWK